MPLGHQELIGICVKTSTHSEFPIEKLKPIKAILDDTPILDTHLLALAAWCADYYQHPLGEVLHSILPTGLRKPIEAHISQSEAWRHTHEGKGLPESALRNGSKQQILHKLLLEHGHLDKESLKANGITSNVTKALEQKGLIERFTPPLQRPPQIRQVLAEQALELNEEQQAVLSQIRHHNYGCYLLEGATGSGKTEVYLHAIHRTLQAGQQALVLVPEIGLTPQTLKRFKRRFAVEVVELHSNVSEKQRNQNWLRARAGLARIVIGTRLACFAALPELGLIIIDEEHDLSFKQQDGLRYSARDVAIKRAHTLNIPLILGSATPSLESLNNAITGRYGHLRLTQRAGQAKAPELQLVDMRKQERHGAFAFATLEAIKSTLQKGEQILVFINRRGFAPVLFCEHCGWFAGCNACESKMTLHNEPRHLRCHHCDRQSPVPRQCPSCQNPELHAQGAGTQRTEIFLQQHFANTEVIRVDQDSMQSKTAMQNLNKKMAEDLPCILVGTQMLAKGHHFPKVTLAVLLDVDQGLFSGDFRGAERMGQLIIQVAGRAGRESLPGSVIIQSYQPEHPMLNSLLSEGYHRFARRLLAERKAARLPPYWYMAMFRAESKRKENAIEFLKLVQSESRKILPPSPDISFLGPLPCLMEKKQDRFRYQFQITCAHRKQLQQLLKALIPIIDDHALSKRTRWSIDVDPQDMSS